MGSIDFYKEKVNNALENFLEKKLHDDGKYSREVKELIKNVMEFNLRSAKRIRPLITIFSYKCSKEDDRIIDASIFIELMQAFLLIHDDIMDRAILRRGKKSFHKIYENYGDDFGISMAILAGDLCESYTYESIIDSYFSDKEKAEALKWVCWIINREIYGQTLDIIPGFENLKEEDVWKIYELKTATYTMQGPIYIGCILANAPKNKIEKLQEYAYNIGIAFQIQDDLNGIFGDVDKLGKPNDSDIKEGKKTLIIAKTLELCDEIERDFILKEYGNKNISHENIEEIRNIIKKCGAFDYCYKKFHELIKKGKDSVANLDLRDEGKKYLIEMADYIGSLFR